MSWRECLLQELIEIHDHRRVPLSGVEREKRKGEFRYYGAQGVIDHVDAYIFDGDFVLVAEDGENLRSRKQPIAQIARGQFWVNNHAHILRAKDGVSNNEFICALLNWLDISPYVTGAAQPKLSQGELKAIRVLAPDAGTQQQIATVLSAYDDLIATNQRRIALLEDAARRLYREWFVHLRFPGHESVPLEAGIPSGWEVKLLEEVAPLNYGKAMKATDRKEGKVPVYGSSGVVGTHNVPLVESGAIVVGRKGNVGSLFYSPVPCFPIDTVFYIAPVYASYWLFLALHQLNFISSDAAVPGLNRSYAHSLPLLQPADAVAQEFERLVQPMFEQSQRLTEQNARLAQARDLLLPKLMSGQLDVSGIRMPDEIAA